MEIKIEFLENRIIIRYILGIVVSFSIRYRVNVLKTFMIISCCKIFLLVKTNLDKDYYYYFILKLEPYSSYQLL